VSFEETAGGLGIQIVQCSDANAAVRQGIHIGTVFQTGPDVVVVWTYGKPRGVTVLMYDPVTATRLISDVVHHCELAGAGHEQLDFRGSRVAGGLGEAAVAHTNGLAPIVVGFLVAGVVGAETDRAVGQCLQVGVAVLRTVVTGQVER
jgi:hypothetical protein